MYELLSMSFMGTGELNFTIWHLGAAGTSFRVRVWNKAPHLGGNVSHEQPPDSDPANYFDNRWKVTGL